MAPHSKSVKSYADVHQAFTAAGQRGAVVLEFPTHGEATVFCARANAYRVLLRKQNEAAGRDHTSDFDHLMVCRKAGASQVLIKPRGFNFTIRTVDGEEVNLDDATLPEGSRTPHDTTLDLAQVDAFLEEYEREVKP